MEAPARPAGHRSALPRGGDQSRPDGAGGDALARARRHSRPVPLALAIVGGYLRRTTRAGPRGTCVQATQAGPGPGRADDGAGRRTVGPSAVADPGQCRRWNSGRGTRGPDGCRPPDSGLRAVTHTVTLISGDGIGPEITAQTVKVLEATGVAFAWDEQIAGIAALDSIGTPIPDAMLESIHRHRIALKGPLTTPVGTGFRSVNVALRKEFKLFANVRPTKSLLPGGRYENIDLVLVRENLEGLYVGVEHFVQVGDDPRAVAESLAILTREGCERVLRFTFDYA
ncbi:MAG: hypothetical protein HKM89_13870, partial [Gemmatimonadales bacterium]|nr:hypothetical protein [Gemmatimonadales bacterium]